MSPVVTRSLHCAPPLRWTAVPATAVCGDRGDLKITEREIEDRSRHTEVPRSAGTGGGTAAPGHDVASHKRWMTAFWHTCRIGGPPASPVDADVLRYVPRKDLDFLDEFYRWYRRFPVARHLDPGHLKTQTHLTVLAYPEIRDFTTLGALNHGMLVVFYVDDHRLEIDLAALLDDTRAHPVVHEFTEQIRSATPAAHTGFMDVFREFCAGSLLQGKVGSTLLYSRVKSTTMGILPVHYLLWSLRGLAPEKFGALKLHDYLYRLELDTVMVNDRHSLQKESAAREWNGMAVHGLTDEQQAAAIDANYARLIASLGDLLATEDDPRCVAAYENFKICADATKTWEEFSPRYHSDHRDATTDGKPTLLSSLTGPTGLGTTALRIARTP
jgi:hypothetical protein